jgi:FtsP/CotA-like multicopper oxidase with cupredoxin domain
VRALVVVVAVGVTLAVLSTVALVVAGVVAYRGAAVSNVGELAFTNALHIPPLLEPTVEDDGTKVFDLQIQTGSSELLPGVSTPTWGVNGTYLGPTLRAERGDVVRMRVGNATDEASTLHWHGMHLPAAADGGPHQMVAPGETWTPSWTIDQPAATLWYHPHLHGRTAEQVLRGVAGMFILDDEPSSDVDLPSTYGVDDIPLIVQDRSFDGDGEFETGGRFLSGVGQLGDEILVNGTYDPHLQVDAPLVRFRLLNGSNARVYDFGFADGRAFAVVGTDGGLLPAPVELDRLQLSPGERAEVVVAFEPGDDVVLRSFAPDLGGGFPPARFDGGDDTFDILRITRPPGGAADDGPGVGVDIEPGLSALPRELVSIERLNPTDAVATPTFRLEGNSQINGESMDVARIDHVAELGTTEVWEVVNASGGYHNFHVHDVQFQVVDLDGRPPPPELAGWKDTLFLSAGARARLVLRFEDYADPDLPYMYHCHLLRHEDSGMMGQFVVVEPGQQAGEVPMADHEHGHHQR